MLPRGRGMAGLGMSRGAAAGGHESNAEEEPCEPAWRGRRSCHNQLDDSHRLLVASPPNQPARKAFTAAIVSGVLTCTIACMPTVPAAAT
jgi:hypothetical protein